MADVDVHAEAATDAGAGAVVAAPYATWERIHRADQTVAYAMKRVTVEIPYPFDDLRHDLAHRTRHMVGFHIRSRCPACFHVTSAVCATKYLAMKSPSRAYAPQKEESQPETRDIAGGLDRYLYTALRCSCIENHAGAPAGTFGCGAEWMLRVSYEENKPAAHRFEGVPAERAATRWVAADVNGAAVPTSLTTFQATAGRWQAGLTAIVALVSVGSLLTGRSTFQSLATQWQIFLAIALGLAIVLNGFTLAFGNLASNGSPSIKKNSTLLQDFEQADLAPLRLAVKGGRRLKWSFWLGGAAVLASVAAISILLFVGTPRSAQTYKVTYAHGNESITTSCGTIGGRLPGVSALGRSRIRFTPRVGMTRPTHISHITSIAGC